MSSIKGAEVEADFDGYDDPADTKHYWSLTKHIFRYSHLNSADSYNGAHTVNEGTLSYFAVALKMLINLSSSSAIRAEGYLEMIRFFTHLILNADEAEV